MRTGRKHLPLDQKQVVPAWMVAVSATWFGEGRAGRGYAGHEWHQTPRGCADPGAICPNAGPLPHVAPQPRRVVGKFTAETGKLPTKVEPGARQVSHAPKKALHGTANGPAVVMNKRRSMYRVPSCRAWLTAAAVAFRCRVVSQCCHTPGPSPYG